jgi:hypothetical protein
MDRPPYDIVCGRNYDGQNVDCSDTFFHNYLTNFINVFVKKILNEMHSISRLLKIPSSEEMLKFKKSIFRLCLDVAHYDMFDDFMKTRATRVEFGPTSHSIYDMFYVNDTLVNGPQVPFGVINGGKAPVPVLTIQGQQRDCRVVNLYISGLIMYMLGQFGWIHNYPLHYVPSYTQYFPNSEDLSDQYVGRALPSYPQFSEDGSALPDILQGEAPIPTPIDEIALLIINFFGGFVAKNFQVAADTAPEQRPVGPHRDTLTYVANTLVTIPPVPTFTGESSSGVLVWNNKDQLKSTSIFLSAFQRDRISSSLLDHPGIIGLHISDKEKPNNFQSWNVSQVNDSITHFEFRVILAIPSEWRALNNQSCNVTILLKDGEKYPGEYGDFIKQVRAATHGGAKKRNKSKRRNQKKSIKKNRHHNRKRLSRRKRFY